MADKGNNEETGQLSSQLAMQQGDDRRSNPGPDIKEKSNSETKEKQKGPSGDSSREFNIQKPEEEQQKQEKHKQEEEKEEQDVATDKTIRHVNENVAVSQNKGQDQDNSILQAQITVPGNNSPSGDSSRCNASKRVIEITRETHSGKEVDGIKDSKPEELKEGPSGDSSRGNASKKVIEITRETHSGKEVDGKKDSKPEELKEESNIQKPEEEQEKHKQEEEKEEQEQDVANDKTIEHVNVAVDENKDQDQDNSIFQAQITVPGNNSPSGDSSRGNASKRVIEITRETHSGKQVDGKKDSKPETVKEGPSGDSSRGNASKKVIENTRETHSVKQVDGKKDSKPEELKEESNIQKPEEEQQKQDKHKREEEKEQQKQDVAIDKTIEHVHKNVAAYKSEDQDQDDLILQPQITVPGNNKTFWICAAAVILLAAVWAFMCSSDSTPPVPNELNVVDVFNQEMKKLEDGFPNQRPELWRRSLIHLRRHLKTKNPTEPVSLILTSGYRAEKTLGCLAQCLAEAFSTALNSSVLNINGKDKASQDSDQVKLDIDSELKKAFEGKKSAAVVHRFEELPPGSTLIFYRYCDHENAAYKNVFLAFTVMLDAEVEVPSNVSLGKVEEMVQDHIKHKFVSSDKSAMFNQMDVDKLSGLWSRISHLILPVAAEEKIEQQGCEDCNKSF